MDLLRMGLLVAYSAGANLLATLLSISLLSLTCPEALGFNIAVVVLLFHFSNPWDKNPAALSCMRE